MFKAFSRADVMTAYSSDSDGEQDGFATTPMARFFQDSANRPPGSPRRRWC